MAANAAAGAAAAEQAVQQRLATVPFTCAACEAVSETGDRLKGCNACRISLGEESAEWPRYCIKGCQKDHWAEHRKVCVSKQGGRRSSRDLN